MEVFYIKFFYSLPRFIRDLIIFNSFILMIRFLAVYLFKIEFNIRSSTLMAANVGILIVNLFNHRVAKVREEEKNEKNKK